jgi:hypothetical protein
MAEVVVCRYGEDLAWTRNLPRDVRLTIYDKGEPDQPRWPGSLRLTNHSRDDFAWLHHLVERYDDLSDWTIFAQGRPFDHAPDLHRVIRSYAKEEDAAGRPEFSWLGFLWETDDARGRPSFVTWSKNPERRELNLEGFFQALWGEPAPDKVRYVGGSQFALSRSAAHRRPRDFYRRARDLSRTFPDAAHAFERTWDRIFLAPPLDETLFGPSGMRLLKPVRPKPSGATSRYG